MAEIPKTFHFIWFGEPEPDYIDTWRERHDDWVFNLWGVDDLFPLVNQDLFDHAEEIAPGSEGQFKADIARYEILMRYGGVYVDCDMEALHAIDDLLRDLSCFAAWEKNGVWVNNAILGSVPGHPLFQALIGRLRASVENAASGSRPNVISGPQYLTPIWVEFGETVFPQRMFYPYSFRELDRDREEFPDAYAVHHWNNTRRRLDRPRHLSA